MARPRSGGRRTPDGRSPRGGRGSGGCAPSPGCTVEQRRPRQGLRDLEVGHAPSRVRVGARSTSRCGGGGRARAARRWCRCARRAGPPPAPGSARSTSRARIIALQRRVGVLGLRDHASARRCRGRGGARCPPARGRAPPPRARASAWASVPVRRPAPGCTTTPAGLSTTIRCSSSRTTSNGDLGGSAAASARARRSRSTSSPAGEPVGLGRAARRPPSRARRRSAAAPRRASAASPRAASAASRRLPRLLPPARNLTRRRPSTTYSRPSTPDDDHRVGQVEGRPRDRVDEVDHRALPRAVGQVAERAAEQHAHRQPQQRPVAFSAK